VSDARRQILSGIRSSLDRGALDEAGLGRIEDRLSRHPRHIVPARVDLDPESLVDLFVAKARAVSATVAAVDTMVELPRAVASYLAGENLPARLVQAPALMNIDWSLAPTVETCVGVAKEADETSLTTSIAGVAETGTLLLASSPGTPTTLNFVPPTHIVVLRRDTIVGSYEDAWDRLRQVYQDDGQPRAANFITGPSRTGDIEQKIEIGVHGPLRLHILVVGR
jgi:L-lactate dehydrogenase complex protein LldG